MEAATKIHDDPDILFQIAYLGIAADALEVFPAVTEDLQKAAGGSA